jgi:hypothetical protein
LSIFLVAVFLRIFDAHITYRPRTLFSIVHREREKNLPLLRPRSPFFWIGDPWTSGFGVTIFQKKADPSLRGLDVKETRHEK